MDASHLHGVTLASAGKVHCAPDWSLDTGVLVDYDLWVVCGGEGRLRNDEWSRSVGEGDFFILRKGERYFGEQNSDDPLVVVYAHFDVSASASAAFAANPSLKPAVHRRPRDFHFCSELLKRMVRNHYDGESAAAVKWLEAALLAVFEEDAERTGLPNDESSRIDLFIRRVRREIRGNPGRRWFLPDVARRAGYSSDHFSRLFKRMTGLGFKECVLSARMEAAKFHLRNTEHGVGRIADILGYNDVYLFSKQFKQKTGRTPTAYRGRSDF